MREKGKYRVLKEFLQSIQSIQNLTVYRTESGEDIEVVSCAEQLQFSFDDALQYFVAKKFDATIVSFDRHFDQTELRRIEPRDVFSD